MSRHRNFIKTVFLFLLILATTPLFAESLPKGYRNIKLGMTVDQVKEALQKDPQFGYRGDRDVSLLPGENRMLIETDTSRTSPWSFLDKCFFQFYEDKLYIITVNVKKTRMDHYSIFSTLCDKYGNPSSLNPEKSVWQDSSVIMSLERPLTLKYTDKAVSEKLKEQNRVLESAEEMSRESFLEGL